MSEMKKFSKRSATAADFEPIEEETEKTVAVPKPLIKRKREEVKEGTVAEKRLEWLKELAKTTNVPKEEAAILKPEHIFAEEGPMIIHLCYDCKKFNSQRQASSVGAGRVQLPLGMCNICRYHLNRQRNVLFFEHKLPAIKKTFSL